MKKKKVFAALGFVGAMVGVGTMIYRKKKEGKHLLRQDKPDKASHSENAYFDKFDKVEEEIVANVRPFCRMTR